MILPELHIPGWIWIKAKRKIYTKSDPSIMEKVIYALSRVEHFVKFGLNYTFKGGTSLLLILPEPKRFSVDVDIVTTVSQEKIEQVLRQVCQDGVFLRVELDGFRSYKPGVLRHIINCPFILNGRMFKKIFYSMFFLKSMVSLLSSPHPL